MTPETRRNTERLEEVIVNQKSIDNRCVIAIEEGCLHALDGRHALKTTRPLPPILIDSGPNRDQVAHAGLKPLAHVSFEDVNNRSGLGNGRGARITALATL